MRRGVRNNKQKTSTKAKSGIGRILLYVFIALVCIGLAGALVLYKYVSDVLSETPPIEVYDINALLEENSIIYDNAGEIIEKVEDKGLRTIVSYDWMDDDIKKAIVAVEDKTFWTHNGFNYVRLAGAVLEALTSGKEPSGTSTITQQYARNMYLPETRFASGAAGYKRKIQEAYYAVELEKNLTKEEILGAYLNTIEFGANAKGIQAATLRYFSKNCNDIDYIEAAILAGIPQANTAYSPIKIVRTQDVTSKDYVLGEDSSEYTIVFNETCLDRYPVVLRVMYDNGAITKEEYEYAKTYDIRQKIHPSPLTNSLVSSYFTDMVKQDVVKKFMSEKNMSREEAVNVLNRGGLRIYTTLDRVMQQKIDDAFAGEPFSKTYNQATTNAVKKFQMKHGLGTDGVAGVATLEKMKELGYIKPTEMPSGGLSPGDENDSVLVLKEALEKEGILYRNHEYMPSMEAHRDGGKNILKMDEDDWGNVTGSSVMLNYYDGIITTDGSLAISPSQYYTDDNGNTVFYAGKMFHFYYTVSQEGEERELQLVIKDAYKCDENDVSYLYGGGSLYDEKVSIAEMYIFSGSTVRIPKEYKSENEKGEFVLSKQFFIDNPEYFKKTEDGTLLVSKDNYSISRQGVIQPQAATCIIDYHNGYLKAIAGGRNVKGQMIYNRAINPRQPGSSIKPLGVYGPAVDNGLSPATVIEDIPRFTSNGSLWPKNWYGGYYGSMTMRECVVQSGNVTAVKFLEKIGVEKGIEYLKKFGLSTVKEDGEVNDNNVSAVALGGMSYGATNFDMSGAFGAIANGGVRNETITFTKIYDKNGKLVLENKPKETYVLSEQAAWLVHDMMTSATMGGFTNNVPAIRSGNYGIPVAGKTGTTSNNYDIWYVGYTPYYSSAMWIGSDVNLKLSATSLNAARYWSKINEIVHEGLEDKSFKTGSELGLIRVTVDAKSGLLPSSLSYKDPSGNGVTTDWFIPGNQPTKVDDYRFEVTTCKASGKIATPFCPAQDLQTKVFRKRIEEMPAGAGGYKIRDAKEIAPKGVTAESVPSDLDFVALAKNGAASPYCFVHTGQERTAQTTADLLPGVSVVKDGPDKLIIAQSIIITTVFDTNINVDAGSVIFPSGSLTSTAGKTIYPWQIKSFVANPNGPAYVPREDKKEDETDDQNESADPNGANDPSDPEKPDNSSGTGETNDAEGETDGGENGVNTSGESSGTEGETGGTQDPNNIESVDE